MTPSEILVSPISYFLFSRFFESIKSSLSKYNRKLKNHGLFWRINQIYDCFRSKRMPSTDQITETAPYLRTCVWATIWYKYQGRARNDALQTYLSAEWRTKVLDIWSYRDNNENFLLYTYLYLFTITCYNFFFYISVIEYKKTCQCQYVMWLVNLAKC